MYIDRLPLLLRGMVSMYVLGRTRNQNEHKMCTKINSNVQIRSGSCLTHLKTSLGRTGLGRLLGGGGLTALSSLTSFASFAGLGWVGNNVEERESLELGQS